jgi:TP901 family phage tail tape measure protein
MVDQRRTVSIDLTATDKISGTLNALAGKFEAINTGLSSFNSTISALASGISSIQIPAGFNDFVSSIRKLDGIKVPDISKLADGMTKLAATGEIKNLTPVATELDKLSKIKVPGVLQLAVGLEKLSGSTINISTAASAIKGIIGPLERLAKINIPKVKSLSDGISSLSNIIISSATSTSILQFVNALNTLNGIKIPDMRKLAAGILEITNIKDLSRVSANLGSLVQALDLFKNVKIPAVYQLSLGFKALEKIDVAKITQNIQALAHAIGVLEKSGTLKNFANLANDLRLLQTQIGQIGPQLAQFQGGMAKTGRSVDDAGKKVKGFGERLVNYIQYRAIADTIMGMQNAFSGAMRVITDYDQSLKDLQAISGATTVEVSIMGDKILDVAKKTKFSASEVAGGMVILEQAGLSASEAVNTIGAVSDLATGTLSDMATTVDLVSTALNVFGIASNRSAHVADVFANAINRSKLTMDKLRTAFNYVGPIAKEAGVTFEESASSMMVLANAGQRASTIGTGLRLMFSNLVDPPKKLADAIEKAGLSLEELDPRVVGMREVLKNLDLVITDTGMAFDIFGKRGAAAVLALKGSGGGFDKMMQTVNDSGTAARMAGIQVQGLGVIFKNLKDRVQVLGISLGDAGIADILRGIGKTAKEAVNALDVFVNSAVGGFITKAVLFTAAISTSALVFGKLVVAVNAVTTAYAVNAVAGASVLATGAVISTRMAMVATPFIAIKVALLAATKAVWTFVTAGTLLSGIVTSLAFPVIAIAAQFVYAARSIDDFRKSSEEAAKAAAKFEELQGGISAYNEKVRNLAEGSHELKDANIQLKKELYEVSITQKEVSTSATLAANSIDSFDGYIRDSGAALAAYQEQLESIRFDKLVESYKDAVNDIGNQTGALNRWLNVITTNSKNFANNFSTNFAKILDGDLAYSEATTKMLQGHAEEAEKSFDFSKAIANSEKSFDEFAAYVSELKILGFDNISDTGKDLITFYDNAHTSSTALINDLLKTNKLSLGGTVEQVELLATSLGLTSDQTAALLFRFKELSGEQDRITKGTASSFVTEYVDGMGKAGSVLDSFGKQFTTDQKARIKEIELANYELAKSYSKIQEQFITDKSELGEVKATRNKLRAEEEYNKKIREANAETSKNAEYTAARQYALAKEAFDTQIKQIETTKQSFISAEEQKVKAETDFNKKIENIQSTLSNKNNQILLQELEGRKKVHDKAHAERVQQLSIQEAQETTTHEKAELLRLQSSLERNKLELEDNKKKLAILKDSNTESKDKDVEKAQGSVDDSYIKVQEAEAAINLAIVKQRTASRKEEAKKRKEDEETKKKERKEAADAELEKLRLNSRERINILEQERIEISKMAIGPDRAKAEAAISKKISEENINLKRQELAAIELFEQSSAADKLKAERSIQEAETAILKTGLDDQRKIVQSRLEFIKDSWRQSAQSIEEYKNAVTEAFQLGLLSAKEYNEKLILSGQSMIEGLKIGLERSIGDVRTFAEVGAEIGEEVPGRVADGFSDMFVDFANGTKSATEAIQDWAIETLSWIGKVIMRQMILNAIMNVMGSSSPGGAGTYSASELSYIPNNFADGGSVPGRSPHSKADNIPAWLTADEFVQPVSAVKHYGTAFMEAIRTLRFPKDLTKVHITGSLGNIPRSNRLSSGGMARAGGPAYNVNIEVNGQADVKTEEKENDTGGIDLRVLIDTAVAQNGARHGTKTNKMIRGVTGSGTTLKRR